MHKSIKNLLSITLLTGSALVVTGCQNPNSLYMPPAHSGLNGLTVNAEDISHHLQTAINRLNILKLQGGVSCVPASVWTINKTLKQADKNLRANLLVDAANSVILAESQLTHAQERVNYLTERTDCNDTITASLVEKPAAKINQTVTPQTTAPKTTATDDNKQRFAEQTINIIELLLNGNNQFASDKAELTVSYISHLELAAPMINQFDDITIMLTGHTDAVGSEKSNQDLSQKRVEMVKSKLIELGVKESQITIVAKGESVPLTTNNTATGRLANRRVSASISITTTPLKDSTSSTNTLESQQKPIQPIAINTWWQILEQPADKLATNATEYPHTGR